MLLVCELQICKPSTHMQVQIWFITHQITRIGLYTLELLRFFP